jgi:hypothetical protein
MPYRKRAPEGEFREMQRLLSMALIACDREIAGQKPRVGDIYTPIDSHTGKPLPNLVVIQTSLQRVMAWLLRERLPRSVPSQQQLQFARWRLWIRAGARLADILREEVPEKKRRLTMRKNFERWRRAQGKGASRDP